MCLIYPLRPQSRGSVHIRTADPTTPPQIITNFLTADADCKTLVDGLRRAREIVQTAPIGAYVSREVVPGEALASDEAIVDFARQYGTSGYHTVGTTAMGPGDDDVVDADARVRGVDGLRVVDASVFPHLTAGNNNAPDHGGRLDHRRQDPPTLTLTTSGLTRAERGDGADRSATGAVKRVSLRSSSAA